MVSIHFKLIAFFHWPVFVYKALEFNRPCQPTSNNQTNRLGVLDPLRHISIVYALGIILKGRQVDRGVFFFLAGPDAKTVQSTKKIKQTNSKCVVARVSTGRK